MSRDAYTRDTRTDLNPLTASGIIRMMPPITIAQFYEMVRANLPGLRAVFELADNVEHIEVSGHGMELRHERVKRRTGAV